MTQRILLVEDDSEIARIVKATLEAESYMVTWATTGLEGLADFKTASYDLALVDLMLPEMDGFNVCKNIRLQSDIPIIILSACKTDMDKVEGFTQGADDYLAKPFSLVELKARVASQLRRWQRYNGVQELAPKTCYVNDLCIIWQAVEVYRNGQFITLTKTEFDLLVLLAKNPERVFSKEELYEAIWQQQATTSDTHTVTVHIKSLREKLQDPVKKPLFIQTVWGKGYRFIGEVSNEN